jgi:hypothetical protein
MKWIIHKHYMQSDNRYRIVKSGRIPMIFRYVAYCPKKKLVDGAPFFDVRDAIRACEIHSGEK